MWKFWEKRPFFRADMAGLGSIGLNLGSTCNNLYSCMRETWCRGLWFDDTTEETGPIAWKQGNMGKIDLQIHNIFHFLVSDSI